MQWLPDSFSFWLPNSKTDRIFEGNRIIICNLSAPDSYGPVLTYIKSRDSLFPNQAELWLRENGSVPTHTWFLYQLQSLFPTNIAGQSICASDATDLAFHSFPPDTIMLIR